ncbi:MAG: DUF1822 family protein [Leptolyngbyaceae cyanobacterium SL_7_1]|nr:DUF1822 family protein [Leptolyngbyaceae cyanobacterium SL_7_1]
MVYNTLERDDFALPLPITHTALAIAEHFANQQPTPDKATQVWLNTLAVHAVHDYLEMMGIATDLKASDSWNSIAQLCADTADLMLPDYGRLECRPVSALAATCPVPPEVWDDRIGYVIVQIEEATQQATLLGFVEHATVEELPLNQLQPIDALFDHLYALHHSVVAESQGLNVGTPWVNLSQWVQHQFDAGWMAIESLLTPQPDFAYAFRSTALSAPIEHRTELQRAKLLRVGYGGGTSIVLVVALEPNTLNSMNVYLEAYPAETNFLPPDLQMVVVNQEGDRLMENQAGSTDAILPIQLELRTGEQFRVQITLDDTTITEYFVV